MKSILGLSFFTLVLILSRKMLVGALTALTLYLFGIESSIDVLIVVFAVCTVFSGFLIPMVCAILAKYFDIIEWSWAWVFIAPIFSAILGLALAFVSAFFLASTKTAIEIHKSEKEKESFMWGE